MPTTIVGLVANFIFSLEVEVLSRRTTGQKDTLNHYIIHCLWGGEWIDTADHSRAPALPLNLPVVLAAQVEIAAPRTE